MTVDEELNQLEDNLRRLKIEYDIFFGGGSKRPPTDLDWRVQSQLKRHSDSQRLSFSQRFKFNSMQQKYAIYSDLWRKKVNIKEAGYRRPQDELLSIQGIRTEQMHDDSSKTHAKAAEWEPLKVKITDPNAQRDTVRQLFDALSTARLHAKETSAPGSFDSFASFVQKKTSELRTKYHCKEVEYEVEMKEGKVKLVARPKT
ncbi:MAG: MXAN_5187 C-terminal domain-containing protein [Terriglobales bacterium]